MTVQLYKHLTVAIRACHQNVTYRAFRKDRRRLAARSRIKLERLEPRHALAAVLALEPAAATVLEGERADFSLRLSAALKSAETVTVTLVAESATYGVDFFAPLTTRVLFAPGQTVQKFSVPTLRDAGVGQPEGRETFRVIATPTLAALGTRSARVTIADYVPPPAISVDDIVVVEGDSGSTNAVFTVKLSSPYPKSVTCSYATQDGTATVAGSDYAAASGTLVFAAGEISKSVTVSVIGDRTLEPTEQFGLELFGVQNATLTRGSAKCTIENNEIDTIGYQITLSYNNPAIPAAQKAVFERAVTRLQQIVIGDIPGVTLGNGTFIDDIRMQVYVEAMDPAINGYARALQWRPGTGGLPYEGEIHINESRIGNPGIYHTIIHECLHAMGFYGTFFQQVGMVAGLGTTQPLFTGTNARREYGAAFSVASPTGVPLYGDLAAQGSYGSHWNTATIGTEIMSVGWDTTSTALRPFSRITAGALHDLGYQVNYSAADFYTPPPAPDPFSLASAASTPSLTARTGVDLVAGRGTSTAAPAKPSAPSPPQRVASSSQRSTPPGTVSLPKLPSVPVSQLTASPALKPKRVFATR